MRPIVWIHGGIPMNEAELVHDDLLHALLPMIPRTPYQDIRRLNTFVWAIVGLCLTHTVRLSAFESAIAQIV